MEEGANTIAYGLPKETVAAIMMLNKNTKVKVRSTNGDTKYFIVVGVLERDTLAPHPLIICLDYVFRTSIDKMKDNGLKLANERSRRYPTQTITDADYADDIALLANLSARGGNPAIESGASNWRYRPPSRRRPDGIYVL